MGVQNIESHAQPVMPHSSFPMKAFLMKAVQFLIIPSTKNVQNGDTHYEDSDKLNFPALFDGQVQKRKSAGNSI